MIASLLSGFGLGISLILAIGAQNAFVLRQGLRGEHVAAVVAICALSETALVSLGVFGFGALVEAAPWLEDALRWGGAAFLFAYGARAAWSAWRGASALTAAADSGGLRRAVAICLGVTWLNPHAWLDTVVLLGGISATAAAPGAFGAGAILAAWTWFSALGFGARFLRPIFARPAAWRVLDAVIAVVMWTLAVGLLVS